MPRLDCLLLSKWPCLRIVPWRRLRAETAHSKDGIQRALIFCSRPVRARLWRAAGVGSGADFVKAWCPTTIYSKGGVKALRILRQGVFGLVLLSTLFTAAPPASAAYPDRPVHRLIGFLAGGPVDIVARIFASGCRPVSASLSWSRTAPVPAATSRLRLRSSSAPDGYTLLFVAPNNAIMDLALPDAAVRLRARHHAGRGHHAAHQHAWSVSKDLPVKSVTGVH